MSEYAIENPSSPPYPEPTIFNALFHDLTIGYNDQQCDYITSLLYVMKVEEDQCKLL